MVLLKKFLTDTSGATAIEYGLIAALIAVALIGGATALGGSVNDKFSDVAVSVDSVDEVSLVATGGGGD